MDPGAWTQCAAANVQVRGRDGAPAAGGERRRGHDARLAAGRVARAAPLREPQLPPPAGAARRARLRRAQHARTYGPDPKR